MKACLIKHNTSDNLERQIWYDTKGLMTAMPSKQSLFQLSQDRLRFTSGVWSETKLCPRDVLPLLMPQSLLPLVITCHPRHVSCIILQGTPPSQIRLHRLTAAVHSDAGAINNYLSAAVQPSLSVPEGGVRE